MWRVEISVDFVGYFNKLNAANALSSIYKALSDSLFEEMTFQACLIGTYIRIIENLDPKRYALSIRPYSLENIVQYRKAK